MKFASLGSGSSGNATLVASADKLLLVDCGFALRETRQRLSRLGLAPEDLSAILVTHEHGDHCKGVGPLARKFDIPVYMTQGTSLARDFGELPELKLIKHYQSFDLGDIRVIPVAVPHDAREPAQFVFEHNDLRLGVLTDLGSITSHVSSAFSGCDGLLVEANHDLDMLWSGPYPASLKSRVASDWGHLNNHQTADLLELIYSTKLQKLVIGHISLKNNSVAAVVKALEARCQISEAVFACQDEGFDWMKLVSKPELNDC